MAIISQRRGGGRYDPVADINITPFVDVMLVLLIVFMITAPMLAAGMIIDLPRFRARPSLRPCAPSWATTRTVKSTCAGTAM
jgi:biopolymer transport protein TolR